jgi:hypothetical protein
VPVDLHAHSRVSDGSDDPATLVDLAAEAGLSALALTDHDTQDGIAIARSRADEVGIELIPGTEISCGGSLHLVVLFLEPGVGPLQDQLEWIRTGREERNAVMLERLASHGIHITPEELAEEAGEGVVGRPHVAARLVAGGHAESIPDAFARWLGNDQPGYVPRRTLPAAEAVRLARESGAVPIVAHPHTLDRSLGHGLTQRIRQLADAGLVGIEIAYPGYDRDTTARLRQLADRFGLLPSGGSDYHGTYKPHLDLGTGTGDLVVPEDLLEALRERAS